MNIQLLKHIHENNILAEEQFGFRTLISTDMAIYKLLNEILKTYGGEVSMGGYLTRSPEAILPCGGFPQTLKSKNLIGGLFCDLEKAFDSVNHKILLLKLEFYDIKGKGKSWFESYLSDRY
jgi:hypothetical protein